MVTTITLGLSRILVGTASPEGNMPESGSMTKIGKTYKDTCKITQDQSEATEHYEEGKAAPEYRKKSKKVPKISFSLMDVSAKMLADYMGGKESGGEWSFNGDEKVPNYAIRVEPEQGLAFNIPNGDIEAVINADMSAKGIFLLDVTVTPMAVNQGGAIRGKNIG